MDLVVWWLVPSFVASEKNMIDSHDFLEGVTQYSVSAEANRSYSLCAANNLTYLAKYRLFNDHSPNWRGNVIG